MDQASWAVLRQMWTDNTNLTVICSFRTFGAHCVNYETEAVSSIHPSDPKEGEINLQNELMNNFVDSPCDGDRLLLIELKALDEKATFNLASRLLNEHNACVRSDDKMLNTVYKLSGGNPLYAVEVSKAAIKMITKIESPKVRIKMAVRDSAESKFDSIDVEKIDDIHHNKKWAKAFQKVSASLRSERIEEVIIFRFDQLNYKSQLLLKIAAVAGFNNAPFTAEVLCFILPDFSSARTQDELFDFKTSGNSGDEDSDEESGSEDLEFLSDFTGGVATDDKHDEKYYNCRSAVIKALDQILRESDFIRICKSVNESSEDGFDNDPPAGDVNSAKVFGSSVSIESYEFSSSLVQATILNLNLRNQNAILHRQTATYLERELLPRLTSSTSSAAVGGGSTTGSVVGEREKSVSSGSRPGTDSCSLNSISSVSTNTVSSAQW